MDEPKHPNTRSHEEREKGEQKYVAARIEGNSREASCEIAGFNPGSRSVVERNNKQRIIEELNRRGLDENGMAEKYKKGMERIESGDTDFDGQAYAKMLLQVGYLRGHGKESPTVAIQNNFGTRGSESDDPGATRELLREVADGLRAITEEISRRRSDELPGRDSTVARGDSVCPEAKTHPRVDGPGGGA